MRELREHNVFRAGHSNRYPVEVDALSSRELGLGEAIGPEDDEVAAVPYGRAQ